MQEHRSVNASSFSLNRGIGDPRIANTELEDRLRKGRKHSRELSDNGRGVFDKFGFTVLTVTDLSKTLSTFLGVPESSVEVHVDPMRVVREAKLQRSISRAESEEKSCEKCWKKAKPIIEEVVDVVTDIAGIVVGGVPLLQQFGKAVLEFQNKERFSLERVIVEDDIVESIECAYKCGKV